MPTSFLSIRSENAVQRLAELQQLRDIAKSVDAFKERRDQLAAERAAFAVLAQHVRLLRAHGVTVDLPPLVGFLQVEFAKIQANFESQPDSLTQANLRVVFNQSAKCRGELEKASLLAWESYVDTQRLKVDPAILNVLVTVPSFHDSVLELENLDDKIEQVRTRVPQNEQDFDDLHHDIGEMRRIWDELQGGGLPKEVLDFLRIVGNRNIGARLELLDKVRPWLQERGLEASFRVVISS